MNYHQAKRSVLRGRVWGGTLLALASVSCVISILKFLYYGFDSAGGLSFGVATLLRTLVRDIYIHTPLLSLFWEYAPLPDATHYFAESNVFFALTYCCAVVGLIRCHFANTLARRVFAVEKVLAETFHLHPMSK